MTQDNLYKWVCERLSIVAFQSETQRHSTEQQNRYKERKNMESFTYGLYHLWCKREREREREREG